MQHEVLDGIFTFYDSSKAKLNIYQVMLCSFLYPYYFLFSSIQTSIDGLLEVTDQNGKGGFCMLDKYFLLDNALCMN